MVVLVSGGRARTGTLGGGAARELLCPPAGQAGALMAPQAKASEDKSGRLRATLMQCRQKRARRPKKCNHL